MSSSRPIDIRGLPPSAASSTSSSVSGGVALAPPLQHLYARQQIRQSPHHGNSYLPPHSSSDKNRGSSSGPVSVSLTGRSNSPASVSVSHAVAVVAATLAARNAAHSYQNIGFSSSHRPSPSNDLASVRYVQYPRAPPPTTSSYESATVYIRGQSGDRIEVPVTVAAAAAAQHNESRNNSSSTLTPRISLRPSYPNSTHPLFHGENNYHHPHPHHHVGPGNNSAHLSQIHLPPLHSAEITHKRPRLDLGPQSHNSISQPLRIDTRDNKDSGYHPQVEAISPTGPIDSSERDDLRSTKDDLLQKITKVDREIAKAESQIAKLKKKQQELEIAASKPCSNINDEDEKPKNQSIAQIIYAENRKKARQAHAMLEGMSPMNELPLYNQPSDTITYHENKRNHTHFKKLLVESFKKRNEERETRERILTETYCKLTSIWMKKVERIENSKKRREKEQKARELYEKIFPELRKQREDKERDHRLGSRGAVRSEADIENVIERLQEQELETKKMHSYAVIPPLLLAPEERKRIFINNNGLILDPMKEYEERKFVNTWTEEEQGIFKEKFLQHPKNFAQIAQFLERKTVAEAVQHYYLSKKTENYKQVLRKSRVTSRRRRVATSQPEVIAPNIPGVVTRHRNRHDIQEKNENNNNNVVNSSESNNHNLLSNRSIPPLTTVKSEPPSSSSAGTTTSIKVEEDENGDKKAKKPEDSSDEEIKSSSSSGPPVPCIVCKSNVERSRPVNNKTYAAQLGLKEEDIGPESKVCNACHCKAIRKKHAHCLIPTCTSTKGRGFKVKNRLRHLPGKWNDLPKEVKEPIMSDMQLPEGLKKCCAACFTRINRKISQINGSLLLSENVTWTEEEIDKIKASLRENGRNWNSMIETLPDKTQEQCKKFFYNFRKKYSLDKIVLEYKRANLTGDQPPTLSTDEESGSSTSSCEDETHNNSGSQTETVKSVIKKEESEPSSSTVVKTLPGPETEVKKSEEDYDSSATMSADEVESNLTGRPTLIPNRNFTKAAKAPEVVVQVNGPGREVITVKELMLNVIERSLSSNQGGPLASNIQSDPTIHTLLEQSGPAPHKTNYIRDKIGLNPLLKNSSMAPPPVPPLSNDYCETLDLSMPHKREVNCAPTISPVIQYREPLSHHPRGSNDFVTVRPPPPAHSAPKASIIPDPYRDLRGNSGYRASSPRILHRYDRPSLLTPPIKVEKPLSIQTGSITQGTPVNRGYEPLLRVTPPPETKGGGSITHGTPLYDKKQHFPYERSNNDYFKRSAAAAAATAAPSYSNSRVETPHLSSRQVLMNDFAMARSTEMQRRNESPALSPRRMLSDPRASLVRYEHRPEVHQRLFNDHRRLDPRSGRGLSSPFSPAPPGYSMYMTADGKYVQRSPPPRGSSGRGGRKSSSRTPEIDIYRSHPEVTISKTNPSPRPCSSGYSDLQPSSSSSQPNPLNSLVDVAVQQPKLPDITKVDHKMAAVLQQSRVMAIASAAAAAAYQQPSHHRYSDGGSGRNTNIVQQVENEREKQNNILYKSMMIQDYPRMMAAAAATQKRPPSPTTPSIVINNSINALIHQAIINGPQPESLKNFRTSNVTLEAGPSRSPSVKSDHHNDESSRPGSRSSELRSGMTIAEHTENLIKKDLSSDAAAEYWRRRHGSPTRGCEERQITRISVSPAPNAAATTTTGTTPTASTEFLDPRRRSAILPLVDSSKLPPGISPIEFHMEKRIAEEMKKTDMAPPGPSKRSPAPEEGCSPRKRLRTDDIIECPDSPGSGEMVIDESVRPESVSSNKTASPAPLKPQTEVVPPRYEPLSDDE